MSRRALGLSLAISAAACAPAPRTEPPRVYLPAAELRPSEPRVPVPVLPWDAAFEWHTSAGAPLCATLLAADEHGGFHAIAPFQGRVEFGALAIESGVRRFLTWHARSDGSVDSATLLPDGVEKVQRARASGGILEIFATTYAQSATLLRYDASGALASTADLSLAPPLAVTLLGQGSFLAHDAPRRERTRLGYFRDGTKTWQIALGPASYDLAPAVSRDGRVAFLAALLGEPADEAGRLRWARLADGVTQGAFPDPANTIVSEIRFDRAGRFWAFGNADFRLWIPPEQRDTRGPDAGNYAVAWAVTRDLKLAAWVETDLRSSRVREVVDTADEGALYFVIGVAHDAEAEGGWLRSSFAVNVAFEPGIHLVRARLEPPSLEVGRFPSGLLAISSGSAGHFVAAIREARSPAEEPPVSTCRYASFRFGDARP